MKKFVLIPTGDEVKAGLVLDTNSPALMELILERFPRALVIREEPVIDDLHEIRQAINRFEDSDLILVIGGSGGGRRYDPALALDVTHTVLENLLENQETKEIYGYNGHLWSRLIIGKYNGVIVANVPGPMVEAVAAARVIIRGLAEGEDLRQISVAVAEAVMKQYPLGGIVR
jgi:molybdopterin biosynthesis enzyme